jgi:hypothetical protein
MPDLWCRGADRQTIAMALQGLTTGIDAGEHRFWQHLVQYLNALAIHSKRV